MAPIIAGRRQLTKSYLTQHLFRQILGHIERLAGHPTCTIRGRTMFGLSGRRGRSSQEGKHRDGTSDLS